MQQFWSRWFKAFLFRSQVTWILGWCNFSLILLLNSWTCHTFIWLATAFYLEALQYYLFFHSVFDIAFVIHFPNILFIHSFYLMSCSFILFYFCCHTFVRFAILFIFSLVFFFCWIYVNWFFMALSDCVLPQTYVYLRYAREVWILFSAEFYSAFVNAQSEMR